MPKTDLEYNLLMIGLIAGVLTRIFSNSYLNVFQKILTKNGEHSSVINFYTYLGLVIIGFIFCHNPVFDLSIMPVILTMGLLGSLGNYFIIKALSCGELSVLAPINSYKPVVALIFGILFLGESPEVSKVLAIVLIIMGTFILIGAKTVPNKAYLYRFLALFFSGTEAVFIKKLILVTDIKTAFFYWALAGLIFAFVFALRNPLKISRSSIKIQLALIVGVAIMQYSTNYVFSRINVAYGLALFQLSTLLSVFLGVNIFKEKDIARKIIASVIMIIGAVIIIL